jgi:hypothetical protein
MGWMKPLLDPMNRTLSVSPARMETVSVAGYERPLIVK